MVNFNETTYDHHHNQYDTTTAHATPAPTYFVPPYVKRETTKISSTTVTSGGKSNTNATVRDDDWKSLANSITYLFHKKQLQKLELDILNEKVRNVHYTSSRKGEAIVECYKESILKKGNNSFTYLN